MELRVGGRRRCSLGGFLQLHLHSRIFKKKIGTFNFGQILPALL